MKIKPPKTRDDLIALLSLTEPDALQALYDAAYASRLPMSAASSTIGDSSSFPTTALKIVSTAASVRATTKSNASTHRGKIFWPWLAGPMKISTAR